MAIYKVFIVRSVGYTVEVEAESVREAEDEVSQMDYDELYEQGEFQHDIVELIETDEVIKDD
jgi:hypothetical protein